MKELSATDLAWLAGLIDGEGCIRLNLIRERSCTPYLSIFMKHYETMKEVSQMTGGTLQERKPQKPHWSKTYGIQLTGDRARATVEAVRPYLRTKALEAWLLLEALAQSPKHTGNKDTLTDEDEALRVGYSLAIHAAKQVVNVN